MSLVYSSKSVYVYVPLQLWYMRSLGYIAVKKQTLSCMFRSHAISQQQVAPPV